MTALEVLDSSDRWRRAIVAGTVPKNATEEWVPGAQVFFWRKKDKKGKETMKGDAKRTFLRWNGPAVVLGHEKDGGTLEGNYWVAFRGKLYRVAPQLMRMATDEERLSQTVFTEVLAEWKDRLPGGGR